MQALLDALHTRLVFGRRTRKLAQLLGQMIPEGSRVLDVGCGDGQISAQISRRRQVSVSGVDILLRPQRHIAVTKFDGTTLPFGDSNFDVVMLVDVLHHTTNPLVILAEATRVSKKFVLVKDHFRKGTLAGPTLRIMDWFGNFTKGVVLPYNYHSEPEWNQLYREAGLSPVRSLRTLDLYPQPFDLLFGRSLHFVSLLEKRDSVGPRR